MTMYKYGSVEDIQMKLISLIDARQQELINHSEQLLAMQYKRLDILRKGIVRNNRWRVILAITALLFGLTLVATDPSDYLNFVHLIFGYQLSPFLILLIKLVITAVPIGLLIKSYISIHKINKLWRYDHTELIKDIQRTKLMTANEIEHYQELKDKFNFE